MYTKGYTSLAKYFNISYMHPISKKILFLVILLTHLGPKFTWAKMTIRIRSNSSSDLRNDYQQLLIKEICKHTQKEYGKCIFITHNTTASSKRVKDLIKNGTIDIMGIATRASWESELEVIRIPIMKGLLGLRVFFILESMQSKLSYTKTLKELKKDFSFGLGTHWSTNQTFRELGFNIINGDRYDGLFKMLLAKRFDLFPRGVNEILDEYKLRKKKSTSMIIEKYLALYIPLPTFFFINPKNKQLKKRITSGLDQMMKDGSFDRFFNSYFNNLKELNLNNRKFFIIKDNPILSAKTKAVMKKYQFKDILMPYIKSIHNKE